jgi:hypothetical protein
LQHQARARQSAHGATQRVGPGRADHRHVGNVSPGNASAGVADGAGLRGSVLLGLDRYAVD